MKRTILGYIKTISKKNLVYPGFILALMVILVIILPIRQVIFPENIYYASAVSNAADEGNEYICIHSSNLVYTGYDYCINGKAVGSYYYTMNGASDSDIICQFFLLPCGSGEARESSIHSYTANARILQNNKEFDSFLQDFSQDVGWSASALKTACGGILISSYNYHRTLYLILGIAIALISLVCLIYIISNLAIMINPSLHEAAKRLDRFGLDSEDFTAIDEELAHNCIVSAGNLHVTYHYLIAFEKHTLSVIPLFNIIWAYRFSGWNRIKKTRKETATLVVVTSPKDKIVVHGSKRRDVDKILRFLDEDFSRIAVGYSEETRREIEELLNS